MKIMNLIGNSYLIANVDVVDQETLLKCQEKVEAIKENKDVVALFEQQQSDFELDPIETHAERYLKSELEGNPFGLHGYIDYLYSRS